jgi:serine protease inhibitor
MHNEEETRHHINAIVEMQTGNKVKDILPDRQSAATQLLLLSALYFQGTLDISLTAAKRTTNYALTSIILKAIIYSTLCMDSMPLETNQQY